MNARAIDALVDEDRHPRRPSHHAVPADRVRNGPRGQAFIGLACGYLKPGDFSCGEVTWTAAPRTCLGSITSTAGGREPTPDMRGSMPPVRPPPFSFAGHSQGESATAAAEPVEPLLAQRQPG